MGAAGEGNSAAGEVDFEDCDADDIAGGDHFRRVPDEAVGQLTDVYQSILVHADIDKGAEFSDVGDHTFEDHSGLKLFKFAHGFGEACGAEFAAGVTSGTSQFGEHIADGEFSEFVGHELRGIEAGHEAFISHKLRG